MMPFMSRRARTGGSATVVVVSTALVVMSMTVLMVPQLFSTLFTVTAFPVMFIFRVV